jgi:hypothetical protein
MSDTEKIPKHIYDWLDEPAKNTGEMKAKAWLHLACLPAHQKEDEDVAKLLKKKLFCTWRSKRYQCTGASRLGDVWIKSKGSPDYYDHRVDVEELSSWSTLL